MIRRISDDSKQRIANRDLARPAPSLLERDGWLVVFNASSSETHHI